jgi:RHS repeat-associated protein
MVSAASFPATCAARRAASGRTRPAACTDKPPISRSPATGRKPRPKGRPSAGNRSVPKHTDHPKTTEFQRFRTGVTDYLYRYYDPVTGRWPSRDPIGENGGINLYGFVGNDGLNKWDILGLEGDEPGKPYKECRLLKATPLAHGGVRRRWTTTSWGGLVVTEHVERYITLRECKFRCYHENTDSCPSLPCKNGNCRRDHGVEVTPRTNSNNPNRSCASCASIAEEVRKKSIVSGQTVVR